MQSYHRSVHLVEVGGRLWGGKGCVGQVDRRLVGKGCVGQVDRRLARTPCMCEVAGSAHRPVAAKTSANFIVFCCTMGGVFAVAIRRVSLAEVLASRYIFALPPRRS